MRFAQARIDLRWICILLLALVSSALSAQTAPPYSAANPDQRFKPALPAMTGIYFTETGCSHCDAFLFTQKRELEQRYRVGLELEKHDILSTQGYELCVEMLRKERLGFTTFPVLFLGNNIYRGSGAVESGAAAEIEYYAEHGVYRPSLPRVDELAPARAQAERAFERALLPTLAAGLLDGINPCAFSTMLFFLSFMALKRARRRDQLFVGLAFIAAVFAAYVLIGFGLLGALREFFSARRFSRIVAVAVSTLAALFAALNIRDAAAARRGNAARSILQLPAPLQRLNHFVIRHFSSTPLYALGAAAAGFLVSLIELACTGQIYLPTIAYMNQSSRSSVSVALLLVYNLAFIAPLCAVFALFLSGTKHERIRAWYASHLVLVRVLSALFFIALGMLVWVV